MVIKIFDKIHMHLMDYINCKLHCAKVYNYPDFIKKIWMKVVWKNDEFHWLLDINIICPINRKFKNINDYSLHIMKNREVAFLLSLK